MKKELIASSAGIFAAPLGTFAAFSIANGFENSLPLFGLIYFYGLIHALFPGWIFYMFCAGMGFIQWWVSLIGGFVVAEVFVFPFIIVPNLIDDGWTHDLMVFTLSAGGLGMAGGLTAWLVWRGVLKLFSCGASQSESAAG